MLGFDGYMRIPELDNVARPGVGRADLLRTPFVIRSRSNATEIRRARGAGIAQCLVGQRKTLAVSHLLSDTLLCILKNPRAYWRRCRAGRRSGRYRRMRLGLGERASVLGLGQLRLTWFMIAVAHFSWTFFS